MVKSYEKVIRIDDIKEMPQGLCIKYMSSAYGKKTEITEDSLKHLLKKIRKGQNQGIFLFQDPDFEVGKVYLGYFIKDRDFSEEEGYTFTGLEGGTREVQTERTYTLGSDSSNLQVLNNFTGEWEHLGNIIK